MLGSRKKCSNCHATSFRRVKVNRTIQCESCKLIIEERCRSDLTEYHTTTQTEELHCVVTPDYMRDLLVDDVPNDPYCTPGFITAFRMLSPLREPVYAASARTLSGSLAEMERVLGDALFAGYVGYNGRAPGSAGRREDLADPNEKNKSGGDARHTLVAYFEIVELASILGVDKETSNLAVRIFRHTANNTSLRNRNVESLATAAFAAAAERRWHDYQESMKDKDSIVLGDTQNVLGDDPEATDVFVSRNWLAPVRKVTIQEIATAASLDSSEIVRNLKVVNTALRKQRPENSVSITTYMPAFCRRLDLPQKTRELAVAIAEKALQKNICSRRNPVSVSAAAIYLACQLDGLRKTQTEICRASSLTEVTLRKVYKELNREQEALLPGWHRKKEESSDDKEKEVMEGTRPFARPTSRLQNLQASTAEEDMKNTHLSDGRTENATRKAGIPSSGKERHGIPLVPPPLPPGFQGDESNDRRNDGPVAGSSAVQTNATAAAAAPAPAENETTSVLAMLNNPTVQAFANAISMMPQFMPPPPPPLPPSVPPSVESTPKADTKIVKSDDVAKNGAKLAEGVENAKGDGAGEAAAPLMSQEASSTPQEAQGISNNLLAGMQSMVNMMQAMQAIQTIQSQAGNGSSEGAEATDSFSLMTAAMTQAQKGNDASNQVMSAEIGQMESISNFGGNDNEEKAEGRESKGRQREVSGQQDKCEGEAEVECAAGNENESA